MYFPQNTRGGAEAEGGGGGALDHTGILGNVNFCISAKGSRGSQLTFDYDRESFLWAESKRGSVDLLEAFTQLVLTIGKACTFDRNLPPAFLGAFDADKIGFIPYSAVIEVFYHDDFIWNVTPPDHTTKEFQLVRGLYTVLLDAFKAAYKPLSDKIPPVSTAMASSWGRDR